MLNPTAGASIFVFIENQPYSFIIYLDNRIGLKLRKQSRDTERDGPALGTSMAADLDIKAEAEMCIYKCPSYTHLHTNTNLPKSMTKRAP